MLESTNIRHQPAAANSGSGGGGDVTADDVTAEESYVERCDLHSRSSVVLADLALGNAASIADNGGIPPLVELLQTDVS